MQMKKFALLLACMLCGAGIEAKGGEKTHRARSWRKSNNRKNDLTQYFNVDVQADAFKNAIVDTSDDIEEDMLSDDAAPGFADDMSAQMDYSDEIPMNAQQMPRMPSMMSRDNNSSNSMNIDEQMLQQLNQMQQQVQPSFAGQEPLQYGLDALEADEPSDDMMSAMMAAQIRQQAPQGKQFEEEADVVLLQDPTVHRARSAAVEDYLEDATIDLIKKKETATELIARAIDFFNQNPLDESFKAFSHTKDFIRGDLHVFVYTQDGVCIAHPENPELLWKNLYNTQDSYGRYLVRDMISKGDDGGGWVSYVWEGASTLVYVKKVMKDDKAYYLASGFYTHSERDSVVNLVKSAAAFFKNMIKQGMSSNIAFSYLGYSAGNFVQGDLYVYVVAFDGTMVAHGAHPDYVGSKVLDRQNKQGRYTNKEIIDALRKTNEGIWIEYMSYNALKRTYAEKVQDEKGNQYFIACGYYPDADRERAVNLVRKAYAYMKTNGKTIAARAFSDQRDDHFRYGDLYITVYDANGICIADGLKPSLVGQNLIGAQNEEGRYYVRAIIEKGLSGGGWVNYKVNKLYRTVYIEPIDIGVEKLFITCGMYPISKQETMALLVKSAKGHFESSDMARALHDFIKPKSKFKRGDLEIFVLDMQGICLAYGNEYDLIWRNLMNVKDDEGVLFIKKIIDAVKHGPSFVRYKLNNAEKMSYVEMVNKNGKNYAIGSGYYL